MKFPSTLPSTHKRLLLQIVEFMSGDPAVIGIGAGGSFASDSMDQYSDLDLVIAINPDFYHEVKDNKLGLIGKIPGQIEAFTGEHVGAPRLIIALYEPDMIHVDFKIVSLQDAAQRVDNTQVVWEREGKLSAVFNNSTFAYPCPDGQWVEDRFWIWVHYATGKIARGEYFEAMEFLSFLRTSVLSPLALKRQGMTPSGVRTIEQRLPSLVEDLTTTLAMPNKKALIAAYQSCMSLYIALRDESKVSVNVKAQALCVAYFQKELES